MVTVASAIIPGQEALSSSLRTVLWAYAGISVATEIPR
jgi:hypothetical protein